jgi:hypothetical protein
MSEPIYTPTTERIYAKLPEVYRTNDATQGWQLKTWLSGITDRIGELELILARLNYLFPDEMPTGELAQDNETFTRPINYAGALPIGQTSDLVDARSADAAWLPWIAQLVGVPLLDTDTEAQHRLLIESASVGWHAGSREAITNAVSRVLSGPTYTVLLEDHYNGDQWTVNIITRLSEQGDASVILAAASLTKPAGILLSHQFITTVTDQSVGWTESFGAITNACFFPSGSLYPASTLIPC